MNYLSEKHFTQKMDKRKELYTLMHQKKQNMLCIVSKKILHTKWTNKKNLFYTIMDQKKQSTKKIVVLKQVVLDDS